MIPDELIKQIGKMDADTIEKLTDAVFERKRELFPQWDIVYLAMPKNNWEERKRILDMANQLEERFRKESMEKELPNL